MNTLIEQAGEVIKGSLNRATLFQLSFFMLGREPTIQAKLHRCISELQTRKKSLESAYMELEEIADRIRLLEISIDEIGEMSVEKKEILTRQIHRRIKQDRMLETDVKARIKGLEEETVFFLEAYKTISEKEPLKNWDDTEVQLEYWNEKYYREIRDRMLLQMPIDLEIIRSVLALPDDTKVKAQVLQLLNTKKLLKE